VIAPAPAGRFAGWLAAAVLSAALIPSAAQAQEARRCACPSWAGFAAARAAAESAAASAGAGAGALVGGASAASADGTAGAIAGGAGASAGASAGGASAESAAAAAAAREQAPVAIHAEQLEWLGMEGGAREVRFHGGVRVSQGDLRLNAEEVWAHYPAAGGAPSALEACGDVRIRQGPRSARCACVGFERAAGRVVCSGAPAQLAQRCEQVRGRSIAFLTGSGRFFVEGGARVRRRPGCEAAGALPLPGAAARGAAAGESAGAAR